MIITAHFLDSEHLTEYLQLWPLSLALPSGLYTLRAGHIGGLGGLYATGNGDDKEVTVAPQTPPFVERQVVSILHLHTFEMAKPLMSFCQYYTVGPQTPQS